MTGFVRARKRIPSGGLRVNMAHPLARDIAFFYAEIVGSGSTVATVVFYDAVTGARLANVGANSVSLKLAPVASSIGAPASMPNTLYPANDGSGKSITWLGTQNGPAYTPYNPRSEVSKNCTIIARVQLKTKPASSFQMVANYQENSTVTGPAIVFNSSGFVQAGEYDNNYTASFPADAVDHSIDTGVGDWITVGGSADHVNNRSRMWINGVGRNGSSGLSERNTAANAVNLGVTAGSNTKQFKGNMAWVIGFNRILTDAEHLEIHQNVWQILHKTPYPLFFSKGSTSQQFTQAAQATSSAVASLVRQTGKPLQASSSAVASILRQTGKGLQATSATIATLTRQVSKSLQASSSAVATALVQKVALVSAQASSAAVATLVRSTGLIRRASSSAVASLVRQTSKILQTPYIAQAVHFDGAQATGAVLTNNSLTAVDSAFFSFSMWVRFPTAVPSFNFAVPFVFSPNGHYSPDLSFKTDATTTDFFTVGDASGAHNSEAVAQPSIASPDTWFWVGGMADMGHAMGSNILRWWVNDTEITPATYVDHGPFNIGANGQQVNIGNDGFNDNGALDLADVWIAPNQFVDFSVTANRRKFIDAEGKPVYLGSDGGVPTGVVPAIFLTGDHTAFQTNKGTGGAFTLSGTLIDATSSPSLGKGAVATLTKQSGLLLQAASSAIATLVRQGGKVLQASSASVATIVKQTSKILQAPYIAKAVHFATNTRLNNNSLVSTDNQYFSSVFWIKASAQGKTIWQGVFGSGIIGNFNNPTDNKIKQAVSPNSIASVLSAQSSIVLPSGVWTCVMCAFETDFSAGNKLAKVYFGDTDVTGTISDLAASFNVQMNGQAFALGSSTLGSAMDLADVRIMPGINLLTGGDIVQATRRLFVDANGFPVDPQVATAALGAAAVLFSGDSTSFGTNQGGGGSFTASGTAISNATTSPSDGARPIATLVRQTAILANAASSAVANMVWQLGKGLSASSASVASLSLQTGKLLQASSSAVASLVRQTAKILQAASNAIATATAQKSSSGVTAQASTSPVATLTRQFPRSFQASSSAIASLVLQVGKALQASSAAIASLSRSTAKTLQASSAPIATAAKQIPIAIQAASHAIATLTFVTAKEIINRAKLLGTRLQAGLDGTRTIAQLLGTRIRATLSGTRSDPNLEGTKTQPTLDGEVDE